MSITDDQVLARFLRTKKSIIDDPVLRSYKVGLNHSGVSEQICYDISGSFEPIAIRDQIVRACSVIDRLLNYGLISEHRPLLVIGAGHAGIAAAVKAVKRGVKTVVIDRKKGMARLARSQRFVALLQYDWPAEHWTDTTFPWEACDAIPVVLLDGLVDSTASSLQKQYLLARANFPHLIHLHPFTTENNLVISDPVPGEFPMAMANFAKLNKKDGSVLGQVLLATDTFGAVFFCTGFGPERVWIESEHYYHGPEYWTLNKFDAVENGKVLICGGGDGALQDFLLFATTEKCARDIYTKLSLPNHPVEEYTLSLAEEKLRRGEIWWNKKDDDEFIRLGICRLSRAAHTAHARIVDQLLSNRKFRKNLKKIVRPSAVENLHLTYKCDHFTAYYSLNRFLTLLIGTFIDRERGKKEKPVFFSHSTVHDIRGVNASHICQRDFDKCRTERHYVIRKEAAECAAHKELKTLDPEEYHYVVVRFGIEKSPGNRRPPPALPGTQILPYSV